LRLQKLGPVGPDHSSFLFEQFPLPDSQLTTSLASTPPTYWEIEANGKSSRVNLQAFFLVPVYKAA